MTHYGIHPEVIASHVAYVTLGAGKRRKRSNAGGWIAAGVAALLAVVAWL